MKGTTLCALFISFMCGQCETVSVLSVFMDKVWECMEHQPHYGFADQTPSSDVDVLKYTMQSERYFKDNTLVLFQEF